MFADVILPLALPKRTYTYAIPDELVSGISPGLRVEVQFGKSKLYSGVVARVHTEKPDYPVKPIAAILDEVAVVSPQQLQLWHWLAEYYCCTLGEVMAAALPGHLKLTGETKLVFNPDFGDDFLALDDEEYLIGEALQIRQEISIEDARKILNKKTVFPVIQRLMNKGVLFLREDLQEKYRPRKINIVRLAEPYRSEPELLKEAFLSLDKNERQAEVLMAYLHLSRSRPYVSRRELLQYAGASESPLKNLIKKAVLEISEQEISRLSAYEDTEAGGLLSDTQQAAMRRIAELFAEKSVVLLHGITGSGKTQIYIEQIRETVSKGGQVLYLLPEIALTTQIVNRLRRVFGADVAVYHSKIGYNERVEVWRGAATGKPILLAARSGLFLPFQRLQLIIVDEEHDNAFKQFDPAPRYNARDAAVYLAQLYGAKTLLGTATPSLESYHNALTGKYGLVELGERYGGAQLPEIELVDLREQLKTRQMHSIFSTPMLSALQSAIEKGEQSILFQNRRGYSPILECQTCGWNAVCRHCDVSLTYHKQSDRLRCHYCGYQIQPPPTCPACGSGKISLLGFGTEKIEDELRLFLADARLSRMDLDTAGSKANLAAILNDFEERQTDILIGTQMVTKGLDFENVGVVGVLGADQLVRFPDFRAGERAFQLVTQVAGRAGRKNKRGKVLIQTYNPQHPVLQEVLRGDFQSFIQRELAERQKFGYPPFTRLIHVSLQHKEEKTTQQAAEFFGKLLREQLGDRVLGPVVPHVPRMRGLYGRNIMLKLEKSPAIIQGAKDRIRFYTEVLLGKPGWGQVKIQVDVDPM